MGNTPTSPGFEFFFPFMDSSIQKSRFCCLEDRGAGPPGAYLVVAWIRCFSRRLTRSGYFLDFGAGF